MLNLRDLRPKLEGTFEQGMLRFDCPVAGHVHKIRVPLGTSYWHASGTFPDSLTVVPSISASGVVCRWHGNISNGKVVSATSK